MADSHHQTACNVIIAGISHCVIEVHLCTVLSIFSGLKDSHPHVQICISASWYTLRCLFCQSQVCWLRQIPSAMLQTPLQQSPLTTGGSTPASKLHSKQEYLHDLHDYVIVSRSQLQWRNCNCELASWRAEWTFPFDVQHDIIDRSSASWSSDVTF